MSPQAPSLHIIRDKVREIIRQTLGASINDLLSIKIREWEFDESTNKIVLKGTFVVYLAGLLISEKGEFDMILDKDTLNPIRIYIRERG